jgi:hypothetical protein
MDFLERFEMKYLGENMRYEVILQCFYGTWKYLKDLTYE